MDDLFHSVHSVPGNSVPVQNLSGAEAGQPDQSEDGGRRISGPLSLQSLHWLAGPTGDRPYWTFAGLSPAAQQRYLLDCNREWNVHLWKQLSATLN